MKPVIALVGRPNVGKSTLFNRLTRSRDALVADLPGLTRDRHYGEGRVGERPFLVVDTGGFEPVAKEGIMYQMALQTKQAVAEAEQMAGVEVAAVYAGVAGGHIHSINSRGVTAVTGRDREVSAADVERAVDQAKAINIPQDREIIHVLPQDYIVDEQDGIREPLGMSGVRLEAKVHIVTAAVASAPLSD